MFNLSEAIFFCICEDSEINLRLWAGYLHKQNHIVAVLVPQVFTKQNLPLGMLFLFFFFFLKFLCSLSVCAWLLSSIIRCRFLSCYVSKVTHMSGSFPSVVISTSVAHVIVPSFVLAKQEREGQNKAVMDERYPLN